MKKRLRLIGSLLVIASVAVIASGCRRAESDGSGYIFVYELAGNPRTLDPQTATDEFAQPIMANLFEGLLRMDSLGNIIAGVAMEYEISPDFKTYTFYLRNDVFWSDRNGFQAQCTAADFVFAFKRLFNPAVKSRNAAEYYSILNSKEIHEASGSRESSSEELTLGVYSDGDFKLIIELEHPDTNFPVLLTAPPAFPCNEEFYIKASGRYGLVADAVASNGGFYLRDWVYDPWWTDENKITLRRNELNSGAETVYPAGVNFLMDSGGRLGNFTSGKSDCIIVNDVGVDEIMRRNFPYTSAENSVWGITFNGQGVFVDRDLRLALAVAADISAVDINQIGYRRAAAIVPDSIKIEGEFYRDLIPDNDRLGFENGTFGSDAENRGIAGFSEPPVLIMPITAESNAVESFVRTVTQQWQEKLSLFCKIEALSLHEYEARIVSGDYDIAVTRITARYNSPLAVLGSLSRGDAEVAELLKKAERAESAADTARHFLAAEKAILQAAEFIPICFMSEYFFYAKKSEDLIYNPFTRAVIFRNAKMY
ncbi:MAG: ABC transporter substrate-binding protein [Oscillospiraceae bacterium]|nr:ABC transporter substrate-binding protein [Oscillospiraceae bacterium]